jgi:hypothetical protein
MLARLDAAVRSGVEKRLHINHFARNWPKSVATCLSFRADLVLMALFVDNA